MKTTVGYITSWRRMIFWTLVFSIILFGLASTLCTTYIGPGLVSNIISVGVLVICIGLFILVIGDKWNKFTGEGFAVISDGFQTSVQAMDAQADTASGMLEAAFAFLETAFGKSQEMVVFVTELNTNFFCTWFIGQNGSEAYTRNNKELMIGKQRQELMGDIGKIKSFLTVL